jgi:hypothetical protein
MQKPVKFIVSAHLERQDLFCRNDRGKADSEEGSQGCLSPVKSRPIVIQFYLANRVGHTFIAGVPLNYAFKDLMCFTAAAICSK